MFVLSSLRLSNSLASSLYLEGTHQRAHPLHILTDADSDQTRAKCLSASHKPPPFKRLRSFGAECEERLQNYILLWIFIMTRFRLASRDMVPLWSLYSEYRPKAERDVQAAVVDLKIQIYARVQENSNAPSFFAPSRLPVEMLAIWRFVATTIPR